MRFNGILFAIGFALGLGPAQAFAACQLSLDPVETVNIMGIGGVAYDGFERSSSATTFSVTVRNNGDEDCSGHFSLQNDDGRAVLRGYGGDVLDYRLESSSGESDLVTVRSEIGNLGKSVPFTVSSRRVKVLSFSVEIAPNQIVPSGVYDSTLLARLFDGSDSTLLAERPMRLATTVRAAMAILLFEGGIPDIASREMVGLRSRQLDFDKLEEGEQAALRVLVQSNDDYAVTFSSHNGGALWHDDLGAAEQIPYEVTFGGVGVAMASGESRTSPFRATGLAGATDTLSVRIGRVGTARAGRYSDEITIRVVPEG